MSASSKRPRLPRRLAVLGLAAAALFLAPHPDAARAEGFGFSNFTALVKKNGNTQSSTGVQGSTRTATGRYEVEFSRPITSCLYVASPFGNKPGQVVVRKFPGNPTKIRVSTFAPSGQLKNLAFIVLVSCS